MNEKVIDTYNELIKEKDVPKKLYEAFENMDVYKFSNFINNLFTKFKFINIINLI